jgi:hypothetical protein
MGYEDESLGLRILELGRDLLGGAFFYLPVLVPDLLGEKIRGHG